MDFIDTHCHLDGEEFKNDLDQVIDRARNAGCSKVFVPAIDLKSSEASLRLAQQYPGYVFPMVGLHPEEVRLDWKNVLSDIGSLISRTPVPPYPRTSENTSRTPVIAIGEVGLDFYWSREFEKEQLKVFEEQVKWSLDLKLPLMIHCRKAQNEMVTILKKYKKNLCGGVFHCFTGNEIEARQLLEFDGFVLGIGGVLTFKKSNLPETLASSVPLDRIVLETDAPYMSPVPLRGQRNEPANIVHVIKKLAECYGVTMEEVCKHTNLSVERVFGVR